MDVLSRPGRKEGKKEGERKKKKKMKGMRGSLWASLGICTLEELTRPWLNALSSQASKINSVICSLWIYTAR